MSNKEKDRRCKSCHKRLIDEKLFCRRCVLEGRNKVSQVGGIIGSRAIFLYSVWKFKNNDLDNNVQD